MKAIKGLNLFKNALSDEGKKRYYYALYTLLFVVLSLLSFSWFITTKTSFIYASDGWEQHFKAYVYYGRYLRGIIDHLIQDHKLVFQDWDFAIGEGSDVVNTLHYYVIGDPLTVFTAFVHQRDMNKYYNFTCVLRIYLAGLSFSALCFGTERKNRIGILAGAYSYAFCAWNIWNVARHPYFMNPLIYFPLMVLGIEKIIKKKKPYLFILSVTLSAISNFYFFYMIVFLAIIYAVVRIALMFGKNFKDGILTLLRIGVMSVVGVLMSGVLLLPVLMMFLQDSRLSMKQKLYLFYPLNYYSKLPSFFVSNAHGYWLCLGLSVPAILALFLILAQKKNDRLMKIFLLISALVALFPIGGRFFNGMSYMTNRWSWVLSLLFAYILVIKWDELVRLNDAKEKTAVLIMCTVFYAICIVFLKSRTLEGLTIMPLFFIILFVIAYGKFFENKDFAKQLVLLGAVFASVVTTSYLQNSPNAGNYVSECVSNVDVDEQLLDNDANVVKKTADTKYPRYTGEYQHYNNNMLMGISSTQYYWSLSNPYANEYKKSMEFREYSLFKSKGYDDRTTPIALSSTDYYVAQKDFSALIPYGFEMVVDKSVSKQHKKNVEKLKQELGVSELTDDQEGKLKNGIKLHYYVYKNKFALPRGYCYDSYITRDEWEKLDAVQKQEVELDAAVVDEPIENGLTKFNGDIADYEVPYEITIDNDRKVTLGDGKFVTTSKEATATITIDSDITNAETYVEIKGYDFTPVPKYDLYFGDKSVDPLDLYNKVNFDILTPEERNDIKNEKRYWNPVQDSTILFQTPNGPIRTLSYTQPEGTFANGRHDFIVNMGYSKTKSNTINLTFLDRGFYKFSEIKVYKIPMDNYEEKISKLSECVLEDMKLGTDSVKGKVNADKTKLLCLAVSYSDGWKGFIDGKEVNPLCVNQRYLGLVIPEGEHSIKFTYDTPYKKEGAMLSLLGLAIFVCMIIFGIVKKQRSL